MIKSLLNIEFDWSLLFKSLFDHNGGSDITFFESGFWLFFGVVLLVFGLAHKRRLLRNTFLFFISLFFYWKCSGFFFLILIFSTLSDYFLGHLIGRSSTVWKRKSWLAVSITINLLLLIYFKYAYFFADSFNGFFGTDFHPINHFASAANGWFGTTFKMDRILLPVGISFYTFQTISYAIDVYRKDIQPVKNVLDFGFYVSFFPQLVAGPIVRASEFIPQLYKEFKLTKAQFGLALFWILNGLLKKVLLADYLALNFVDRVFEAPGTFPGFANIMALYGYSLQVYADFSGYTDIAIGIAMLLGFVLPQNFNSPYKAAHVGEFWKRWHMSLSSWLKDYLYIPMGGNRKGTLFTVIAVFFISAFSFLLSGSPWFPISLVSGFLCLWAFGELFPQLKRWYITNINIMVTMLLGGLWHGASWNFVFWGGLNGLGIVVYKIWKSVSPVKNVQHWVKRLIGIIITFNFITFTRIWFRSGSNNNWDNLGDSHNISEELNEANTMLDKVLSTDFSLAPEILSNYRWVFTMMLAGFIIHWLPEKWKMAYRNAFAKSHFVLQILACIIVGLIIYNVNLSGMLPFIYFQF